MATGASWDRVVIIAAPELVTRWRKVIGGDTDFLVVDTAEAWSAPELLLEVRTREDRQADRLAEFFEKKVTVHGKS